MKRSLIVRVLSLAIILVSFWFIAERLWIHLEWLKTEVIYQNILFTIGMCSISYGVTQFLLSMAWRRLLSWCGHKDISQVSCNAIYGRSQIAKYIPGNVFHFAGRHMLGNQAGINHVILTGAAIYEVLGLLTMSGAIAVGGMVLFGFENGYIPLYQIASVVVIAILLSLVVIVVTPYIAKKRGIALTKHTIWESIRSLWMIYYLYLLFFLFAGLFMVIIVSNIVNLDFQIAAKTLTIFSIAWIAGFIVPGAPGGVGVREAVIVFFLAPIIGEAQALTAAIALRFVTLFGDIFFFFVSDKIGHKLVLKR